MSTVAKQRGAKSPKCFLLIRLLFICLAGLRLCFGPPDLNTRLLHPATESEGKRLMRFLIPLFLRQPGRRTSRSLPASLWWLIGSPVCTETHSNFSSLFLSVYTRWRLNNIQYLVNTPQGLRKPSVLLAHVPVEPNCNGSAKCFVRAPVFRTQHGLCSVHSFSLTDLLCFLCHSVCWKSACHSRPVEMTH